MAKFRASIKAEPGGSSGSFEEEIAIASLRETLEGWIDANVRNHLLGVMVEPTRSALELENANRKRPKKPEVRLELELSGAGVKPGKRRLKFETLDPDEIVPAVYAKAERLVS